MKLLHIADLHLGKRVNGFSMVEDQRYILEEILRIAEEEKTQAVLIAGDVYDKPVPAAEAVELFDQFLVRLSELGQKICIIAGNHDSAERLAFGGRLMDRCGVYFSPAYRGVIAPVELEDTYGMLRVYLLPFLKPQHIHRVWMEEEIENYTDAMRSAISHLNVDPACRNILVTHQFVTGGVRCESEELSVGGSDNVDASVFADFEYVALGHLHGPQQVGRETIRYAGSPLKYSFSESVQKKSATLVELRQKGDVLVRMVPLTPARDLIELRGNYEALTLQSFYTACRRQQSYVHITLTDEEDVPNAVGRLRVIYPYLMKLDYDNQRTKAAGQIQDLEDVSEKSPEELFSSLFEMQNGRAMSNQQADYLEKLIAQIWEEQP